LRMYTQPPLPLLLREFVPVGSVHHHELPAGGDHEPQAESQHAAQNAHAHANPLAGLRAEPVDPGFLHFDAGGTPAHGALPSATGASSFESDPTSGSAPAGKT